MTAEIAVMNRIGVALAADSAVSLGQTADKIYTSADKLFHLSSKAPVGIMINGNATFLGIPWETVIKAYRASAGTGVHSTLQSWAHDFFAFLAAHRQLFPNELQDYYFSVMAHSLLEHVRDVNLRTRLDAEAEQRDGLDDSEIPAIIDEVVKARLVEIRGNERLPGFSGNYLKKLRENYLGKINEIKASVFGNLKLSSTASRGLTDVVVEMIGRYYFGPYRAGVVFAGFGEEEYMPRMIEYAVEGMINGKLRALQVDANVIEEGNTAVIRPFAQQEMVHSFLQGVNPVLFDHMQETTSTLFNGSVGKIVDVVKGVNPALGTSLENATSQEIPKLLGALFTDWQEQCRQHWLPIVQIASSLPKDELASMAESLVNLTKFRRRISTDRETVGGPIDVAVITKGDGFIWVKRKHYFNPELNPRIIARYGRDGG